MTSGDIAQIITSIASLVAAGTSATALILSRRMNVAVTEIKTATDGLTTKLVESTDRAARSEGKAEGKMEGKLEGILQGTSLSPPDINGDSKITGRIDGVITPEK